MAKHDVIIKKFNHDKKEWEVKKQEFNTKKDAIYYLDYNSIRLGSLKDKKIKGIKSDGTIYTIIKHNTYSDYNYYEDIKQCSI